MPDEINPSNFYNTATDIAARASGAALGYITAGRRGAAIGYEFGKKAVIS